MPAVFKYEDVIDATFKALKELGGTGTNNEIKSKVIEILNPSPEEINNKLSNGRNELDVKLSFSKSLLKFNNVITNPQKAVWMILGAYRDKNSQIDAHKVFQSHQQMRRGANQPILNSIDEENIEEEINGDQDASPDLVEEEIADANDNEEIEEEDFQNRLLDKVKSISPRAFESLCIFMLTTLGLKMTQTKLTRDGGIDGEGTCEINEVLTFRVAVQCKRYADGSVSGPTMSSFRGSLRNGVDRGIFITTSTFSRDAKDIAQDTNRTPFIELIDGPELARILFEQGLGYTKVEKTKFYPEKQTITEYEIDDEFFNHLDNIEQH